jgi:hypothetical protein
LDIQADRMGKPAKLSELFVVQPRQWGLRGDPWLWRDLAQRVESMPEPANADAFVAWLESEFQQLVGVPMTHTEIVFVKQYAHGGMSSGCINPKFWRETLLPFLRQRFEEWNQTP